MKFPIRSITSAAFLFAALVSTHAAERPNIVILYADDMGYGDLGVQNPDSKIPTPNLDRLANEGMRFTDGHSSSGICTPSRYALLTGRYHWRDFHDIVGAFGRSVFKKERLTMPEMLREKGYATACIGKWHLGWDWEAIRKPDAPKKGISHSSYDWSKPVPDGPLDHGFDHYFGDTVINFPPYAWIEDNRLPRAPDTDFKAGQHKQTTKEGSWEARPGPALSDWDFYQVLPTLTEKGVEYLKSRKGNEQPFFLYFSFPSPHAPIIPNDEFDGKSKAGAYGDFVYQTDWCCGKLLEALEEAGKAENTIVIFSADNGAERYAYARDEKFGHWSSGPFRGLKRDVYEGGHHVPFLVRWPGVVKPGVSDALVSQIDVMATLAALTGYDLPADAAEDSHDLLPLLKGGAESPRAAHVHNTYKNQYAVRHGEWVLVNAKNGYVSKGYDKWEKARGYPEDDKQPVELYNLKDDPGQKHNVAAEHPERVAELKALLAKIREDGHSAPRLAN